MRIKIQQVGIYETLVAQLDRIFRHNRQGSFHTKQRYYEAMSDSAPIWPMCTICRSYPTSAESI